MSLWPTWEKATGSRRNCLQGWTRGKAEQGLSTDGCPMRTPVGCAGRDSHPAEHLVGDSPGPGWPRCQQGVPLSGSCRARHQVLPCSTCSSTQGPAGARLAGLPVCCPQAAPVGEDRAPLPPGCGSPQLSRVGCAAASRSTPSSRPYKSSPADLLSMSLSPPLRSGSWRARPTCSGAPSVGLRGTRAVGSRRNQGAAVLDMQLTAPSPGLSSGCLSPPGCRAGPGRAPLACWPPASATQSPGPPHCLPQAPLVSGQGPARTCCLWRGPSFRCYSSHSCFEGPPWPGQR